MQKLAVAALVAWQFGQVRLIGEPQFWQKFASPGFSNSQFSHLTIEVLSSETHP